MLSNCSFKLLAEFDTVCGWFIKVFCVIYEVHKRCQNENKVGCQYDND